MSIGIDTLNNLGVATVDKATAGTKKSELGQAEFLKLMTTQLMHQDPMKPMQNGEFLSQMAQFGTVSGIQDLQNSFKDFSASISSDQALQAASLVGRNVSVSSNEGLLSAGGVISGKFDLPASVQDVKLTIENPLTGEVVKTMNLGNQAKGSVPFVWDGMDENGVFADPGVYKIQIESSIDGVNTALKPDIASRVESVSMGNTQGGVQVNLAGLGKVGFNQIKQIL